MLSSQKLKQSSNDDRGRYKTKNYEFVFMSVEWFNDEREAKIWFAFQYKQVSSLTLSII